MPDEWELAHGFDADDPSGVNGANGDPDHDGVINLAEFIAGTDPRDARSYLRIDSISAGADIALTFLALSDKSYTIQYRPSLTGGSWADLVRIEAQPANRIAVVHDTNGAATRFYRLVTP